MMGAVLIQGQHLVDSYLEMMSAQRRNKESKGTRFKSSRKGPVSLDHIPEEIKLKVGAIFYPNAITGYKYRKLFDGDLSTHGNDHSDADFALVGYMVNKGLTQDESDIVFRASKLYRPKWDEQRGAMTYGDMTILNAFEAKDESSSSEQQKSSSSSTEGKKAAFDSGDMEKYRPCFVPYGMPGRRFVGPEITDGIKLFPAACISAVVALGSVGKTSLLVLIGAHVAAGKDWDGQPLQQAKVVIFCVEESKEELDRKFSALVAGWSEAERNAAMDNLRVVPLVGDDPRLTKVDRNHYQGTGMSEQIIKFAKDFGATDGLVILDHMQGFASGDLNISETATSICREANKIVDATGAAVVFSAHISKANIKAEEVEQGFAVGSLAFENATRQMAGMIPMSEKEADKYGLTNEVRRSYVRLSVAKNSYGVSGDGIWLKKDFSPMYHTVVMTPVTLEKPVKNSLKTAYEKTAERIREYLQQHTWTSRNQLDKVAGAKGVLKASKEKVRAVLKSEIKAGTINLYSITTAERTEHGLGPQVKEVLRVAP